MKKILFTIETLFIAGILVMISCARQDSSPTEVNDLFIEAESEAVFEAVLQNVDDQIDKEISMLEKFNYNLTAMKSEDTVQCSPVITVETPPDSKFPKTITLDFGTGCTDSLGNFRAGKIIVNITGPHWVINTVRNSKLINYIYNDLKIVGDRNTTNKGVNDSGYYVFELKHKEKIWNTEGKLLIDRSCDKERIYNRGKNLSTTEDDEVWITGSVKVEKNGRDVVKEITVPLYRKLTCQNFQSGVITTFIDEEKIAELNYGEGDCDNIAIWTNGEIEKTVTLKTRINNYSVKP
ncbi:MAG: hypothetical protein NT144_11380 [Bacteroidia bacterium]|nr:hypothetical protein [Bacteroidia bacterium]